MRWLNMDKYQELINQIKGKTIDYIVADKKSNIGGFDLVFDDGTVLELYGKKFGWCFEDNKKQQ